MTRDESLTVVEMIISHWRITKWSKEEIDVYARLIQDLDAELTTSAVISAAKTLHYPPDVATLREHVRLERIRLRALEPRAPQPKKEPVPFWVKRWVVGRKEGDFRRFAEQGEYGDLTEEMMPEGAWDAEAATLSDTQVTSGFDRMLRDSKGD